MIVLLPAGLAMLIAALLAVAGFASGWAVAGAAGFCVLALAVGWGELLRLPHRSGSTLLIGGIGVASAVAGVLASQPRFTVSSPLAVYAAVLAVAVLAAFAHELLRQDGRADVVESITGTLSGQIVGVLAAGWVLLWYAPHGFQAIVVAAAAIAVARLSSALALPLPAELTPWVGMLLGTVAAVVASVLEPGLHLLMALLVGVAVSGVGVAIDRLFPRHETRLDLAVLARAAAPVAAAGAVAYAVLRIGVG